MKIALVSPYDFAYPGGVVAHISNLARYLEQLGHTVKILAPAASPDSLGVDNLIAVGRPFPVPSGGSIARISLSAWLEHRVKSLLREEAFDVVHLHEPLTPVLPLAVLGASQTVNVGTFHRFDGNGRLYQLTKHPLSHWFKKLDGRIAVSQPAFQYVSKYFPADYNIVPNGIDVDFFSQRVPPFNAFNDGKLNILFVGRMEKRKGLKYLLAAFSSLKWEYPNLRLLVVGPGSPGKECYRLLAERNVQDVVFLGRVSEEAKRRYLHTADIFCAPNTGKESFGLILGEAMAAGKPIVASNIEGFAAVINDDAEGFLVPPRDEEALALALKRLIDDPALRRRMGERGRQSVEAFRWESVAQRVVECYGEAMVHHAAAA